MHVNAYTVTFELFEFMLIAVCGSEVVCGGAAVCGCLAGRQYTRAYYIIDPYHISCLSGVHSCVTF
jgi:hypothetical protein